MNKDVRFKMIIISILGLLFGRILNRVLPNYFGNKSINILLVIVLTVMFCFILTLAVMKYYLASIMFTVILIPLGIGSTAGVYLNNMDLLGVGLFIFFVGLGILVKVIPKFANKNK